MTRKDKRDIAVIGASLLGVITGSILDELHRDDKKGAGVADLENMDPLISLPALMTVSTISSKIGDSAGVPEQSILRQALVAFVTALALTYFADAARQYLPGLR